MTKCNPNIFLIRKYRQHDGFMEAVVPPKRCCCAMFFANFAAEDDLADVNCQPGIYFT